MGPVEQSVCERCGATLVTPGAACDRCLMLRAMEAPDSGRLGPGFLDDLPMPSEADLTVGKYTILRTVARGGMGVVYQAREAPLNRLVALKMLLGGAHASDAFRQRFLQEAQAAARLNHPAIVKILDWGDDHGQPFFAMEFIEGADLAATTRGQPLPPRRAAEIVRTLAEAIDYAHGQGVLHRDLKPSNVLLDAQGAPRITDFGLAKQLDQESSLTHTGDLIGTPGYLPPEQASARFGTIGPWSDVYGLGGVLYCLITGRPPFVADSTAEVLRAVTEQEPPPPQELNSSVPADLETICLKCLEKETDRRYPTALALVEDLERFLRDEPIQARPASLPYRFRKWVEKNRFPALFAAVAILALVGGTGAAWWQAIRAGHARTAAQNQERLARAESAKSRQTTAFLKELLGGVTADQARGRDTRLLKEMVASAAARVDATLTNQPEIEAEVREIMASTSRHLALFNDALRHAERARVLREQLSGVGHPDTLPALQEIALASLELGHADRAGDLLRRSLDISGKLSTPEDPRHLRTLVDLARVETAQGTYADAEQRLASVLTLQTRTLGPTNADTLRTQRAQAAVWQAQARYEQAENALERVIAIYRRYFPHDAPEKFQTGSELAVVKIKRGEWPVACLLLESVLEHQQKLLGRDHPHTLRTLSSLAYVYGRAGHREDGDAMLREALAGLKKYAGEAHPDTLAALAHLAGGLITQNRHAEAGPIVRQVVEAYVRMRGPDHPDTLGAQLDLARVQRVAGQTNAAAALLHDTLARSRRALGSNHTHTAAAHQAIAIIEGEQGRWKEAVSHGEQAVTLLRQQLGHDDRATLQATHELGRALWQQGRHTNAAALHRANLAVQERALGATHPDTLASLQALVEITTALGWDAEATQFKARLADRPKQIAGGTSAADTEFTGSTLAYTRADNLFREARFSEAEPIFRQIHEAKFNRGDTNSGTSLAVAATLARCLSEWAWAERDTSNSLTRAREGERILRTCRAAREAGANNPKWRLPDTLSRLGFALLTVAVNEPALSPAARAARFAEAETILLASSAALEADPSVAVNYRRDAMERLRRLYETWPKPAEAAQWKARSMTITTGARTP